MRRGGCWTGPEQRHEPFRRPPRLAPLASLDGGTPKRTFHVLGKPDMLFALDTPDNSGLRMPAARITMRKSTTPRPVR